MYNEEDYEVFAKKMETKFPEMFAGKYGGFAVGAGWWTILEALCSQIDGHSKWRNNTREALLKNNPYNHKIPDAVPQVVVEQIKEKFGGLRFYYQGGDDTVDGMVRMAEMWAGRVCEECGKPGKSRNTGWIKTLCDEHDAERQQRYETYAKNNGLEL
jgi:hypothetical protein